MLFLLLAVSTSCKPAKVDPSPKRPPAGADPAEAKAFELIEAVGGTIQRDYQTEGKPIISVDIYPSNEKHFRLKDLAGLKRLQYLSIGCSWVTDDWLKDLAGFTQLQKLHLNNTKVTDAGLKGLTGLTQLNELGLEKTAVTDAGLKDVAGFKQLQMLNLNSTQVTDTGLQELAGLKQLTKLYLGGTQVTDAGVADLQKALPSLTIGDR